MAGQTFSFGTPATTDQADGGQLYILGVKWSSDADGSWTGVQWRIPDSMGGETHYVAGFDATGNTLLQQKTFVAAVGTTQQVSFTTPIAITAGHVYSAAVLTNHYVFTGSYTWPHTDGHLTATTGQLATTSADDVTYPTTDTLTNFHVSPIVDFGGGSVSGTATRALGAVVGAASGVRKTFGSATRALGALTAAATGQRATFGSGAKALGSITGAASGKRTAFGVAAGGLGALTATGHGLIVVLGTSTASLGSVDGEAITVHAVGALPRIVSQSYSPRITSTSDGRRL